MSGVTPRGPVFSFLGRSAVPGERLLNDIVKNRSNRQLVGKNIDALWKTHKEHHPTQNKQDKIIGFLRFLEDAFVARSLDLQVLNDLDLQVLNISPEVHATFGSIRAQVLHAIQICRPIVACDVSDGVPYVGVPMAQVVSVARPKSVPFTVGSAVPSPLGTLTVKDSAKDFVENMSRDLRGCEDYVARHSGKHAHGVMLDAVKQECSERGIVLQPEEGAPLQQLVGIARQLRIHVANEKITNFQELYREQRALLQTQISQLEQQKENLNGHKEAASELMLAIRRGDGVRDLMRDYGYLPYEIVLNEAQKLCGEDIGGSATGNLESLLLSVAMRFQNTRLQVLKMQSQTAEDVGSTPYAKGITSAKIGTDSDMLFAGLPPEPCASKHVLTTPDNRPFPGASLASSSHPTQNQDRAFHRSGEGYRLGIVCDGVSRYTVGSKTYDGENAARKIRDAFQSNRRFQSFLENMPYVQDVSPKEMVLMLQRATNAVLDQAALSDKDGATSLEISLVLTLRGNPYAFSVSIGDSNTLVASKEGGKTVVHALNPALHQLKDTGDSVDWDNTRPNYGWNRTSDIGSLISHEALAEKRCSPVVAYKALQAGDVVLCVSDGVTDAVGDARREGRYLETHYNPERFGGCFDAAKLDAYPNEKDSEKFAKALLLTCLSVSPKEDDITAVVV